MFDRIEYLFRALNEMSATGVACLAMLTVILALVVILRVLTLKKGD